MRVQSSNVTQIWQLPEVKGPSTEKKESVWGCASTDPREWQMLKALRYVAHVRDATEEFRIGKHLLVFLSSSDSVNPIQKIFR